MREIKFRAWDDKSKYMVDSTFGEWVSFDGVPYTESERKYDTPHIEIEKAKNYILMQSTGLKDKRDKEIYEGDIVRLGKNNKLSMMATIKFMKGCFMMEWLAENIRTRDFNRCMYEEIFENCHISLEIIGNIYENEDLLK